MQDVLVAVLRQTELRHADIPASMRASLVSRNGGLLVAMIIAPPLYAALPPACVMALCAAVTIAIGITGMIRFAVRPALADPS